MFFTQRYIHKGAWFLDLKTMQRYKKICMKKKKRQSYKEKERKKAIAIVSEEILTYYMIYNCIMVRVFVVQITAYCMTIDYRRVADPEGD